MMRIAPVMFILATLCSCSLGGLDSVAYSGVDRDTGAGGADAAGLDAGDSSVPPDAAPDAAPDGADTTDSADGGSPDLADTQADTRDCIDGDHDGYGEGPDCLGADCNDGDADIPGPILWYPDTDDDGVGTQAGAMRACAAPEGFVKEAGDCAPDDPSVAPGLLDVCDGVDNNCNDVIDEDPDLRLYPDTDEDGYGDAMGQPVLGCRIGGRVADATDCNDGDRDVNPGETEDCTAVDRNCDRDPYEGAANPPIWYRDSDMDTYGDVLREVASCLAPGGYVGRARDCNDRDASIHPGADELCDPEDRNCDGHPTQGAVDVQAFYTDADDDGFGRDDSVEYACDTPVGLVAVGGDCDDMNVLVFPGSHLIETPNDGIDADCDGYDTCRDYGCDSWPDLVVASPRDGARVFAGREGGLNFQMPIELPVAPTVIGHVDRGDFNGDGWIDIVLIHGPDETPAPGVSYVLLGGPPDVPFIDAPWRFQTFPATQAVVADLNGDGKDDLIIAETALRLEDDLNRVPVVRFGGPNGFESPIPAGRSGASWVSTGELGSDGSPDIAVSHEDIVLLLDSASRWEVREAAMLAADDSRFNYIGDFDGDGAGDVLVVNSGEAQTTHDLFYGPEFNVATPFVSAASDYAAVADINGDGRLDIAFATRTGPPTIFASSGHRMWRAHTGLVGGSSKAMTWGISDGTAYLVVPGFDFNVPAAPTSTFVYRIAATYPDGQLDVLNTRFRFQGQAESVVMTNLSDTGRPQVIWGNIAGPGSFLQTVDADRQETVEGPVGPLRALGDD